MPKDHPRDDATRAAQLSISEREAQRREAVVDATPKSKATASSSRRLKGASATAAEQK